jgi:hypothetical protein
MKTKEILPREKWKLLLSGGDPGPMVSPICDDWSLDIPYYWPFEEPEAFPVGDRRHYVGQQLAMAGICGWDALFLADIDFIPINQDCAIQRRTWMTDGKTMTESRIETPFGPLSHLIARNEESSHVEKDWLQTQEDYRKAIWVVGQWMEYEKDTAIEQGRMVVDRIGDKGLFGTWAETPPIAFGNATEVYFHVMDWPEEFEELHEASTALYLKKLETMREAGMDYIFYGMGGTEYSSPDFFRRWGLGPSERILEKWRGLGGFTLWHTCGLAKKFIEEGFYNRLKPEVFETLSEPPEGDLPSLRWARERLDPAIVTKGNVRMAILLQQTEEEVKQAVYRVREQTKGYRHVVGLSDDLLHNTPLANVLAFVAASRET